MIDFKIGNQQADMIQPQDLDQGREAISPYHQAVLQVLHDFYCEELKGLCYTRERFWDKIEAARTLFLKK